MNSQICDEKVGTIVKYGEPIQLRYVKSQCLVTISTKCSAKKKAITSIRGSLFCDLARLITPEGPQALSLAHGLAPHVGSP